MRDVTLVIAGLVSLCLTGCSVLGPLQDDTRFFVLTSAPDLGDPSVSGSASASQIIYALGPLKMPAYLDRSEVATRVSATEIRYSATDYWAEPLGTNLMAVLGSNLSTLLGTDRISTYPWLLDVHVDYQVPITVQRFECDATGPCELMAHWSVIAVPTGRNLVARESTFTRTRTQAGSAGTAMALSDMLGALSQEIAGVLRGLPPPETKSQR